MAITGHIFSEPHMGDKREFKFASCWKWNNEAFTKTAHETAMQKEIAYVIGQQQQLGLNVLLCQCDWLGYLWDSQSTCTKHHKMRRGIGAALQAIPTNLI